MRSPEQVAAEVIEGLSFSSNRMVNGRLVGEQAIADAVRREQAEIKRLREALFSIQCEQLDRASNTRISAKGHRLLAMETRNRIIKILSPDR